MQELEGRRVKRTRPDGTVEYGVVRNGQVVSESLAPVPGFAPDPLKVQDQRQDLTKGSIDIARGQVGLQSDQHTAETKPIYDRANAIDKVRDGYRQDKRIIRYEDAIPVYASALQSPATPEGDTMLVNAFAKTLDPSTGVQQREGDQIASSAPTSEQLKARLLKEFGSDGAGNFTTAGRSRLREAVTVRMRMIADQYRLARKEHESYIQGLGLPDVTPDAIIGPFAGLPFQDDEARYLGRQPSLNVPVAPNRPQGEAEFGPSAIPPGAEAFPAQMMQAFKSGEIPADPYAIIGWAKQNGGFDVGLDEAKAAAEAMKKGVLPQVMTPQYAKPDMTGREDQVVDPFARGLADAATLGFADEIVAGGDALMTGEPFGARLSRERAFRDFDEQNNAVPRIAGQVVGGFALPSFGVSSVKGLAGVGAGYGAVYGAGSADQNRGFNALMGGAAGGAVGGALGAAIPALARGAAAVGRTITGPPTPRQNALMQAGAEEGVPLNVSDIFPGARNTVATLETIPGASGPVERGISAGRDAIEGRVQQLGRGGTARENMGEAVVGAGERFVEKSARQADRLYKRARSEAGNTPIQPNIVKQVITQLVQREAETPGGTRAGAVIRQYAEAFESGQPITIDGARRMRSELASRLRDDGGLSKREATRLTGQIMDGLNRDIETSLTQAGRQGAVQAYRMADRFYAQRMDEIDRVIEKVIGTDAKPRTPEQAIQTLRAMASPKGDSAGLTRMLKHLSPEERKDFAATLVEPLGRASTEEPFSPATFIRNVRQLSPAARRIIFGRDGERSIQNLVQLSDAKKETVASLNNSRSGQVSNYRTMLSAVLFGLPGGGAVLGLSQAANVGAGATGAATGAAIGAIGLGVSRAISKALMNEDFTRLLARAPATSSPQAINRHIGAMRKLAAKDPNVRSVVQSLEQQMLRAANENFTPRVAASEADERKQDK